MLSLSQKKNTPLADQIIVLDRLANLMKNGYSISRALTLLSYDPKLGKIAKQIDIQLKNGKSLHLIFQSLSFTPIVTSFLYFSQETGRLQEALQNGTRLLKQQKAFQNKFNKTLQYPLILFCFILLLFFFLKAFLLPSLTDMYQGFMGAEYTPAVLTIMNHVINILLFFIIFAIFAWFLWRRIKSKLPVQQKIMFYSALPLLRTYKSLETTYLFSYHFSTLLESGLSIKNALQIMKNQSQLPFLQHCTSICYEGIYAGEKLHEVIRQIPLVERELPIITERSMYDGTLVKDLRSYAEMLVESITSKISKMITYIQPMCYLFFGVIILTVYFSILIPMFNLMQQL